MDYDITVGLEIHAELNTKTKLFCGCGNIPMAEANSNCCDVCLARVDSDKKRANRSAVEKTILAGLLFDCKINDFCFFERKHYDYPDLPGGFQTTQNDKPICIGGGIKLKRCLKIWRQSICLRARLSLTSAPNGRCLWFGRWSALCVN